MALNGPFCRTYPRISKLLYYWNLQMGIANHAAYINVWQDTALCAFSLVTISRWGIDTSVSTGLSRILVCPQIKQWSGMTSTDEATTTCKRTPNHFRTLYLCHAQGCGLLTTFKDYHANYMLRKSSNSPMLRYHRLPCLPYNTRYNYKIQSYALLHTNVRRGSTNSTTIIITVHKHYGRHLLLKI